MAPPLPLTSLSIDPQKSIYKIENNWKQRPIKIQTTKTKINEGTWNYVFLNDIFSLPHTLVYWQLFSGFT